jgi:predicted peptidase
MVKSDHPLNKIILLGFFVVVTALVITIGFKIFTSLQTKPDELLQKLVQESPDFDGRVFHDEEDRVLLYQFLAPLHNDPNHKYPLVVFLHGTQERGDNNINQLKYAGPFFNRPDNRRKYPCFVIIPQCPTRQNWVPKENYFGTVLLSPKLATPLRLTMELVLSLRNDLNIDPQRIYIMGLSSGGSGVWDLAARYPKMFAAAVPFAGCGDVTKARRLIQTPVWVFHGALDLAVSPYCSRVMYHALLKAGGRPRYTEYPMTGHSCWIRAFKDPKLLRWLFARHRL